MPVAHVNNIDMYYEIRGEGEPLLIIWGIGGEIPPLVDCLAASSGGNINSSCLITGVPAGRKNRICLTQSS